MIRAAAALALAALVGLGAGAAQAESAAGSARFCDRSTPLTATQQDRLLRFAAAIKDELEASGARIALVSRSGLNLARFGIRYSHAGLSLKASDGGAPWSVRQLYFSCEERRPRLFDQGVAGFVHGMDDPALGYVSIVLLPDDAAAALERTALDRPRALELLAGRYSANAYAYGTRYQNCNQWVVELMALAWGALPPGDGLRERAQDWLAANAYVPPPVEVGSRWLMAAIGFVPWLHVDDHPADDFAAMRFRTSLPAPIEAFVRARWPQARRLELCHDGERVVVRRGWEAIGEGCVPRDGDVVISLR